jgi:hypothetical protein
LLGAALKTKCSASQNFSSSAHLLVLLPTSLNELAGTSHRT